MFTWIYQAKHHEVMASIASVLAYSFPTFDLTENNPTTFVYASPELKLQILQLMDDMRSHDVPVYDNPTAFRPSLHKDGDISLTFYYPSLVAVDVKVAGSRPLVEVIVDGWHHQSQDAGFNIAAYADMTYLISMPKNTMLAFLEESYYAQCLATGIVPH